MMIYCKKFVFTWKKIFHSLNVKKEKVMSTYNFQAKIASRGYHVYKETNVVECKGKWES